MNEAPEQDDDDDDDDEDQELWAAIREEGQVVATHSWDTGAPGAGAGMSFVYLHRGAFYAEDDDECYGPYATFDEAAEAIGLLDETDATTEIWVDSAYEQAASRRRKE